MNSQRKLGIISTLLFVVALAAAASAQSAPVRYSVTTDPQPATHMLHISMEVNGVKEQSVDVAFPAWAPGAYRIGDNWRQVQEFAATDSAGAALKFEKTDKQTWRVWRGSGKDDKITVNYNLYSADFNEQGAYLRGPSVFMYVVGKAPYPLGGAVSLKLNLPASWKTQTGMDSGPEANTFVAPDYDTFVDSSVVTGDNWEQTQFEYHGVPHYIVFIGKGNFNKQLITDDTKRVVSTLTDMMEGAPYKKYVFFLRARPGNGSGGLEHLNSTDITFSANATHASRANYSRFLFVVAHEYFHLWNVKRIRPQILGPFDYSHEQNTRNLYVSEGMTSYWAALGLRRSGLWSQQEYNDEVAKQIESLQNAAGRKMMSVELSSWDTWNSGSNAANNRIDYYNKGELLGNLLDLEIRQRTQNKRTLLDVFHYLNKNYALPKPGFEEKQGFRNAVEVITKEAAPNNSDFGDFFAKYVSGTSEVSWNDYLTHAGLTLDSKPGKADSTIGITTGRNIASTFPGAPPTVLPEGQIGVTGIKSGSAAAAAGFDIGDVIVALNGDQVTATNYADLWKEQKPGSEVTFTVFRRGSLKRIPVTVGQDSTTTYAIKEVANPSDLQKQILSSWMGADKGTQKAAGGTQ
ncbi:MAG: putative protease with the C-terminal domain [Acidobacteriales bacterium]|nr:putative protease with the C-terminal domain [Terriglobales bacterium]